MIDVLEVNANWISVIPYAYTRPGRSEVIHDVGNFQWWGERPEGVRTTIELAHSHGIKVMLKPQVYIPGSWPGELTYETAKDWEAWESAYYQYVMIYAKMAADLQTDAFCIGTEFRLSIRQRPAFWQNLISEIRKFYNGSLTYAANWDDYHEVTFWDELDFIGIDSYFPLSNEETPDVDKLSEGWHGIMRTLEEYSSEQDRKILFTEFGYLSVDGSAGKHWELEKNIKSRSINEQAQLNALEALLTTCSEYDFWAGGFLWKWFPNGHGHEGYPERDYTPQDKLAEHLIKSIYGRLTD